MEILSEEVNLYYLLGILNSSMANQLLADQRGGDYHIYIQNTFAIFQSLFRKKKYKTLSA